MKINQYFLLVENHYTLLLILIALIYYHQVGSEIIQFYVYMWVGIHKWPRHINKMYDFV